MVLEKPRSLFDIEAGIAPRDTRRVRFAASIAVYGGAIGAAAILVNFLSQVDVYQAPERLALGPSAMFAISGFLAGGMITWPTAFWIYGGLGFFYPKLRESRSLLVWGLLGFCYGVLFPLVMGALFLPVTLVFVDFANGLVSVPGLLTRFIDLATGLWAAVAFTFGFRLFFTGLMAGGLFGVGAWIIDNFNTSADPMTAKYGAWGPRFPT